MDQGWVYVLVNSSMPGMAKVGRTTHPPAQRAAELSAPTGVATPFVLAFDRPFDDCIEAERQIHAELDRRGLRVRPNREFFSGPPSEIIKIILEITDQYGPATRIGPMPCADRLRRAGDSALFGHGDTLQDVGEALRLYKLARAQGSLIAFERMGQIYSMLFLTEGERPRRRAAVNTLKEGARRGNYYCYCELAALFAAECHIDNFVKCWDLFFARRADSFRQELEDDPRRLGTAYGRYIGHALELGLKPGHLPQLKNALKCILTSLLAEIDTTRNNPAARQFLTTSLWWAVENLRPAQAARPLRQPRQRAPAPAWGGGPAAAIA